MQLVDGWQHDEQREYHSQNDVCFAAFKEFYQFDIRIRIDVVHDVCHTIIRPVISYAGQDRPCAPIHPPQQQSDNEGMWHLSWVHVYQAEEQG